jgi:methionyl-tRNA synthetase
VPDYLDRYDPDPLRYLLSINMPETGDTDFSWSESVRRNNEELVATYGNLVNRVLTFTYRNFDGRVPTPGDLSDIDRQLIETARACMDGVADHLNHTRFKAAIAQAFGLAQETNRYLDTRAPWRSIRTDRDDAATTLWNTLRVINCLKIMLAPFLPFSSQSLHRYLGFPGGIEDQKWDFDLAIASIRAGDPLQEPRPLYTKLDPEMEVSEAQLLGGPSV